MLLKTLVNITDSWKLEFPCKLFLKTHMSKALYIFRSLEADKARKQIARKKCVLQLNLGITLLLKVN